MPRIIMENNVIHNNEGYGIILVKPTNRLQDSNGSGPLETAMGNIRHFSAYNTFHGSVYWL